MHSSIKTRGACLALRLALRLALLRVWLAGGRRWGPLAVSAFLAWCVGAGAAALLMSRPASAALTAAAHPLLKMGCEQYGGLPGGEAFGPGLGTEGMVWVAAGRFLMGSDAHYAEEALVHPVSVSGFWIDAHDVTNAQFRRFVAATGYQTLAERVPDLTRHPDLPAAMRVPGSAVFTLPGPSGPGRWRYVAGASWRHPEGPGSGLAGRENHPVVHVAYEDALAYARWLGRELPSEAQWEYAARGGLEEKTYVWGDQWRPDNKPMANTWEGRFPDEDRAEDGFSGTSPVGCFMPNRYGLFDMAGNVWQWTRSWYAPGHRSVAEVDPEGPAETDSFDPRQPGVPAKVIKGGSHLCAPNWCMRYRPAARQAREVDSGTSHIGFRTISRAPAPID